MKTHIITKAFLIAGGNSTLLVQNCEKNKRKQLIAANLGKVDQVGFVQANRLEMMGSELCINATLAFASQLPNTKGVLFTSGILSPVAYFKTNSEITIELPIVATINKSVVLFPGIGFLCKTKDIEVSKELLENFCERYNLPAFGIAIYKNNQLTPYVYVKKTDSLFKETTCGSGSIAISLITGLRRIRQSTGEYISVKIGKNMILVSAQVKETENYDILSKGTHMLDQQLPQTLKGFRDFLPEEKSLRDAVLSRIIATFKTYGFQPLETPTLEYASLLLGKYGDEADKLVYTFTDNGNRRVGLRYDQTVPTARVLAQYKDQLPTYFRRYQVQNVFRADKPQKGRYREFTQCDIDIFGSSSPLSDAEIVGCTYSSFVAVGFKNIVLKLNDRRVLLDTLSPFATSKVPVMSIIQSIDKLDKISAEDVATELTEKGLSKESAEQALKTIESAKPNQQLKEIIELAQSLGVPTASLQFAPSLARGLDYYTGMIFEVMIPELPIGSFGGGGRYDNLIGQLGGTNTPAVGIAFGFDRIVEAVKEMKLIPTQEISAQVLVTVFDESMQKDAAATASALRIANISTELYPATDKLAKQFKYASRQGFAYVVVIGPDEAQKKVVQLKNMQTGEQKEIVMSEIASAIRA